MLELIQEELLAIVVRPEQNLSYNFENMRLMRLCTAQALHQEIIDCTSGMNEKVYLFFDEIQEVADWEKCVNAFRVELDCDIYITGLMPSCSRVNWPLTSPDDTWNLSFTPFHFLSSRNFIRQYSPIIPCLNVLQNTWLRVRCPILAACALARTQAGSTLRKFEIYDGIRDNFPKYVVSMDEPDFSSNGIKHRNIKDFLTMKEWY